MESQLPPPKRGTALQFSVHVYCDQTAGWMKAPLGTEVDLGPGHIVSHEEPAALPRKEHSSPPLFGPCLLWPRSPISATAELLFYKQKSAGTPQWRVPRRVPSEKHCVYGLASTSVIVTHCCQAHFAIPQRFDL